MMRTAVILSGAQRAESKDPEELHAVHAARTFLPSRLSLEDTQ